MKPGFQFADTYQSEKTASLYQARIKGVCHQYFVPVIRAVIIFFQHAYLSSGELPVFMIGAVLNIAEMIFIPAFGNILSGYKTITEGGNRLFGYLVHGIGAGCWLLVTG
jgi:hypothetical protein